jgi:hypothetical protein
VLARQHHGHQRGLCDESGSTSGKVLDGQWIDGSAPGATAITLAAGKEGSWPGPRPVAPSGDQIHLVDKNVLFSGSELRRRWRMIWARRSCCTRRGCFHFCCRLA